MRITMSNIISLQTQLCLSRRIKDVTKLFAIIEGRKLHKAKNDLVYIIHFAEFSILHGNPILPWGHCVTQFNQNTLIISIKTS